MTTVPATYDTLLSQAAGTPDVFLRSAIRMLDEQFGPGYAKANPQLVGQLILASSIDFATASFGKVIGEMSDMIENKDFSGG